MKSNLLKNLLLFYSTVASIFITVSGLMTAPNESGLALQAIFLPVTLYFVLTSIATIKASLGIKDAETQAPASTGSKRRLIVSLVIFVILVLLAIKNIIAR